MKAIAAVLPGRNSVQTRLAVQFGVFALALGCMMRFGTSAETLTAIFFVTVLVVLSAIDIERRILPNVILLPATAVLFVAQILLFPESALEFVVSGLGAALFLLLLIAAYPQGMGMGDVKLALFLGIGLGSAVGFALVAAALSAALFSVGLLLYHGAAARKTAIPFGPFLAFGAIYALFGGSAPFV
jgi:prepilin signal peptidase PulO-like enzyme (type II secretory pathway)